MDASSVMQESLILHWFFNLVDKFFNLLENLKYLELAEEFNSSVSISILM